MGYGMLISVLGRNRHDFDRLLAFYQMFTNARGLMCWQLIKRGSEVGSCSPPLTTVKQWAWVCRLKPTAETLPLG